MKMLHNDNFRNEQVRREYLKYEIDKFTICFTKNLAKEVRKRENSVSRKELYISKVVLLITITTYSTSNIKKD